MLTGASRSTQGYWMPLRKAGAQARRVLLDAVAARWGVPVAELSTEPSRVVHAASGRAVGYGDVAAFATVPDALPEVAEADLKPASRWGLIGHDVPRADVPLKVDGTATFGIDVRVPGMLYASILRSPVQGNAPVESSINVEAVTGIKGVEQVIALPYGVAVLGTNIWATKKGKSALKVEWTTGARAGDYDSDRVITDYVAIAVDDAADSAVATDEGDVAGSFAGAARTLTAEYTSDHVHQAPMEPMNATARVDGDRVEIWAPTQSPTFAAGAASKVAETTPDKVTVHTTFLGGGFGRRAEQDTVVDAVMLAKRSGKPVKVVWSREDDVQHGKYRPATGQCLQAALDAEGRIVGWKHRVVGASIFGRFAPALLEKYQGVDGAVIDGTQIPYAIPARHIDYVREERGVDVGFWRSVGPGYTKFAVETFVDEIAALAGVDPIEYRLSMLADPRARKVLQAVAEMSGWGGQREDGRALGVAYCSFEPYWKTPTAEVLEVSLSDAGQIRVHRAWAAVDPGIAIQPANIRAQVEGGIVYGVSSALHERITFAGGAVQQSNFHDYPLLRMSEAPEVEVAVLPSGDGPPGGVGEISLPPVAPAIANGIYALTGARLRALPFLPERVKEAVAKATRPRTRPAPSGVDIR